jgi:general secretion pathway protein G
MRFLSSTNDLKNQTNRFGFSMIELLVVTTIIIVLTTIGLVTYQSTGVNARNGKRKADMETVRQALVLYRVEQGTYPDTTSFSSMVSDVSDYLSAIDISDPVGDPYVYSYDSDGSTFTLTAELEPDEEAYTLTNP